MGSNHTVEVGLGTDSLSNFYRELSGEVVGVFVATYDVPKTGTPVGLKVSLPGGYEFEADATVHWTEQVDDNDAPVGFGARFVELTEEAKELISRYAANREPLLYEDPT